MKNFTNKLFLGVSLILIFTISHGRSSLLKSNMEDLSAKNKFSSFQETTPTPEPIISECGGVLEGTSGIIEYSIDHEYNDSLRCLWTIRTNPPTTHIELTKEFSAFEFPYDYLTAFSFVARSGLNSTEIMGVTTNKSETVLMTGSVVILQFSSDMYITGMGFRLRFRAAGEPQPLIAHSYDMNSGESPSIVDYYFGNNSYHDNDLSTFVLSTDYKASSGKFYQLKITFYSLENSSGCAHDAIIVYVIDRDNIQQFAKLCGDSATGVTYSVDTSFVIVFYSDESIGKSGFKALWEKQ